MRLHLAVALASAAVLLQPAAAAPIDTVKVCDTYGTGWLYIPGTDICINPKTGETRKETVDGTVYGESEVLEKAKDANEGVALSLALPSPVIGQGKTFAVGANVGAFNGETALGLGGAFEASDGLSFNAAAGVGLGRGTWGAKAGVNYSW